MPRYELTSDISAKDEAICGGIITVLIDPNPANHINVFSEIRAALGRRIAGVIITMVTPFSEEAVMVNRYWMTMYSKPELPPDFDAALTPVVHEMLASGDVHGFREMTLRTGTEEPASIFFLEPVFPPQKLVIAGAGHIGRSLAHLGSRLGFEVTVIDDRPEFANSQNIPEADTLITGEIGEAMERIDKDKDTYAVIVTRGHKDDAAALKPCIGTPLAYTGMIGSRLKVASIREEFLAKGWATEEQWSRIYAPIGLEIGSQTVEEIAVSIAAQLVKVRSEH
jgi:xanthine dehydrogenase accessory factor